MRDVLQSRRKIRRALRVGAAVCCVLSGSGGDPDVHSAQAAAPTTSSEIRTSGARAHEGCRAEPELERVFRERHAARLVDPTRLSTGPSTALTSPDVSSLIDTGILERGSVIDMGGIVVLMDDGDAVLGTPFSGGLRLDAVELAKRYYSLMPDDIDTLALFPNFNHSEGTFHLLVQNYVQGINRPIKDESRVYGSGGDQSGRLQSLLVFANFNLRPDDPSDRLPSDNNSPLSILAHEWAHRFGAFVRFDDGGPPSTALLGRQLTHWCFFADTRSLFLPSAMSSLEGNRWSADLNNTFRTSGATDGYSPLDLYLMGFRAPEDVSDIFYIEPIGGSGFNCASSPISTPPDSSVSVTGIRRDVSLSQIVAVEGSRNPDHAASQRDWRMGFMMIVRQGRFPSPEEVAKLQRLRQEWEPYYSTITDGAATMDTSTGPPAGPPVTFALVRIPESLQAGLPFRFTVLALDAAGRAATDYQGTVRFEAPDDPDAILPSDLTFTVDDRGFKQIDSDMTFQVGGSLSIRTTDVVDPAITGLRIQVFVEPPSQTFCVPGEPDLTDTTTRPWGLGSAFATADGVRFQYLVHRDAIGRPALITDLNWVVDSAADRVEWSGVLVRMAHKSNYQLFSGSFPDPMAQNIADSFDLTNAFVGGLSSQDAEGTGRLHLTLEEPFPYNGIDHLLLEVLYSGNVPSGLTTDQTIVSPDMLVVEKIGPNFPVSRVQASTICLGVRLPTGIVPTITDLQATNVTNTSATISWRTSPSTDGRVLYGPAGSPPDSSTDLQRFDVTHAITLTGLEPTTDYEAIVESRDIDNTLVQGGPLAFSTTELHPSIALVTPRSVPRGTVSTLVRIFGENFFPGIEVFVVDPSQTVDDPPMIDPKVHVLTTNLQSIGLVNISVLADDDAPPGPRRIYLANDDGFSAVSSNFFAVLPPESATDIDVSGRTDGFDLARLARAFSASYPDPRYDVAADLDADGDVDGQDLTRLADRFGQ